MQGIIGKLGNNFLVAAFVPSLWFVVFSQILFAPLDPAGEKSIFALTENLFDGSGFITLILTLLIGFTLMGLNTFIYKLLEGYSIIERIPFLRKRQFHKALKRKLEFELRDKLADQLAIKIEHSSPEEKAQLSKMAFRLRQESKNLKALYKQDYPGHVEGVLPTRFGNILKSFELYALENYGIDSVIMFPRLIFVIDPDYYKKIDQSNNNLAFVVNCMALSFMLSFLCLTASVFKFYSSQQNGIVAGASWELFLFACGVLFGLAIFFYYASLPAARQYGNIIRSAFDLFRFDLLEQLRLPLPENDRREHETWTLLSEFIALGRHLESPRKHPFKYIHDKDQNEGDMDAPIKRGRLLDFRDAA